jgi:hypothetical protein
VISRKIIKIYAKYEKKFYLIDIIGLNEYNFRHNFLVLYEPFPQVKILKALYERIEGEIVFIEVEPKEKEKVICDAKDVLLDLSDVEYKLINFNPLLHNGA